MFRSLRAAVRTHVVIALTCAFALASYLPLVLADPSPLPAATDNAGKLIDELKLEDVTPQTFDPEMDLVDEVGIDSMDLATVALVLRDEYSVRIDEDDYPKLTNVRLIAEYIHQKLAA